MEGRLTPIANRLFQLELDVLQQLVPASGEATKNPNVRVILVLDRSGSMGADFRNIVVPLAKSVHQRLLQEYQIDTVVIVFNREAKQVALHELDMMYASGGTDFKSALISIRQAIDSQAQDVTYHVIFLTDGQATFPKDELIVFRTFISNLQVVIHALGISEYDVDFLHRFVEQGTLPGSFQGSERYKEFDLNEKCGNILQVVVGERHRTQATLCLPNFVLADPLRLVGQDAKEEEKKEEGQQELKHTVNLVWADGVAVLKLFVSYVGEEPVPQDLALTLSTEGGDVNVACRVAEVVQAEADLVDLAWVQQRIEIISKLLLQEQPDVKQVSPLVAELNATVNSHMDKVRRVPKKQHRVALLERLDSLKELVRNCQSAVASLAVGSLNRESKARLLNQAYQGRLEGASGLAQRMGRLAQQRMERNANAAQETDEKIEQLATELKSQLAELVSSVPEEHTSRQTFFDFYRSMDWLEALSEGSEPIGVTLQLPAKADLAVVAPQLMRVDAINSSCLTLEAFLEASKYKIVDRGGDSTSILPGMSRENINGVLGLYINEHHWKFCKLQMPQVLSQMAVGTPLAYAADQLRSIPFIILMKMLDDLVKSGDAAEDGPHNDALTDKKLVLFWQVFRTCIQIARDQNLLQNQYVEYKGLLGAECVNEPRLWGNDVLPALDFLYGTYLAAHPVSENVEQKVDSSFFVRAVVEELRRSAASRWRDNAPETVAESDACIAELVNLNQAIVTLAQANNQSEARDECEEKAIAAWNNAKQQQVNNAADVVAIVEEKEEAQEDGQPAPVTLDSICASQTETSLAAFKQCLSRCQRRLTVLHGVLHFAKYWAELCHQHQGADQVLHMIDANFGVAPTVLVDSLRQAFVGFQTSVPELFNALGLQNQDVLRAAVVQGIELRTNSDRRAVIEADNYVDVWQHPYRVLRTSLDRLIAKKEAEKMAQERANYRMHVASVFMKTDPDTAAGLLLSFYKGNRYGGTDFYVLYKALQKPHEYQTTHLLAKIQMVLTGKYCGITLLNNASVWVPSPKNRRRFARALTGLISDEQKQALYTQGICP